ncbi:hypothetical protein P0Y35_00545 [Kiritimatiellaeota bacterium B1221]|nr:hypothetical protein [Kiritimatiellaeota bacterium B1221]
MFFITQTLFAEGRVAVFDPVEGTIHNRLSLSLSRYDQLAETLKECGFEVSRLTLGDLLNPEIFSPDKLDVIVFEGSDVPRKAIPEIKRFTSEGGVLMNVGGRVPLLVAIEPDASGKWQMSPMQPRFAWQTSELHRHFGFKYVYNPLMHNQGKVHAVSPLLASYAPELRAPEKPLSHMWLVSLDQGVFYPLIDAKRVDGAEVTPQVFIAENEGARSVISLSRELTDPDNEGGWSHGGELLTAMAQIAVDLHQGKLILDPAQAVMIPEELPAPEPLQTRLTEGSVNPEDAEVLVRWGEFNGSSAELKNSPLGSRLSPGESVEVDLPEIKGDAPVYLRIRFAYDATYAGLRVSVDGKDVMNELYVYNDPSGESNHTVNRYSGVPVEMTRVLYVPFTGKTLCLENPGSKPVYLDAVQVERRTQPAPERWVGTGAGYHRGSGKHPIPTEVSQRWSVLRSGTASRYAGPPGDERRWDRMKAKIEGDAARNDRLNLVLSGTPEWAAISPERYQDGVKARRPRTVPPNPEKFLEIVEWVVTNYGDKVEVYELWNEPDIQQFWRGSLQEYIDFLAAVVPVIRANDPDAEILTGGLAHAEPDYVRAIQAQPFAKDLDLFAIHPYAAESVSWDIVYGKVQGMLYATGEDLEIYCNESGFVWRDAEWFKSGWSEARQASALNIAIARLLHGDLAKLSTFHGGGDAHHFGMYNEQGKPRPSGVVFEDYVSIAQPGARRLDVSMVPGDGVVPLQGIYFAGSEYPDGRIGFVVNPAESNLYAREVTLRIPASPQDSWSAIARAGKQEVPVKLSPIQGGLEVSLRIQKRTLVEIFPQAHFPTTEPKDKK